MVVASGLGEGREAHGSVGPCRRAEIYLDRNENPFDLPPDLKEGLMRELSKVPLNRYPPSPPASLKEKIAEYVGLSSENVMVANGSDELIGAVLGVFEGGHVVVSPPTFAMYAFFARKEGLDVVEVPLGENFELGDVEARARGARAIFITSPNNPTGNVQPRARIEEVLETGAPVVLDEAYAEFAGESAVDLVRDYDNLVVLRTFSKAFGLAGARVGYAVASEETMAALERTRPPFAVNALSIKAAEFMLDHIEHVNATVDFIVGERERIYREFSACSYPSRANFLLMRLDAEGFLRERGVHVRGLSGRLSGHIRVSIGKREENDCLIEALHAFMADG